MSKLKGFKSIQRNRLYEEVATSIKRAIFAGDYGVGDKLPSENELAELFQVSRPVIREAIRFLEITGLLAVRQGATGGAFVSGINSRVLKNSVMDLLTMGQVSVGQLTEMRTHIEPEIARLAVLRSKEQDILELEKTVALSKSLNHFPDQVENNAHFHRLLARSSGNLFYTIIEDIIMDFTVEFIQTVQLEHEILHEPSDHEDILQALLNKDPDLAVAITREHITKIGTQMQALEEVFLKLSIQKIAANDL